MRGWWLGFAVMWVFSASGCVSVVPGMAGANQGAVDAANSPLIATRALGDLSSFDACDLVTVRDLDNAGNAVGVPTDSLDGCAYAVGRRGQTTRYLNFGSLIDLKGGDEPDLRHHNLSRGVRIQITVEEVGECGQLLVFADDLAIRFNAYSKNTPSAALCELVDTAVKAAADRVLREDPVAHRKWATNSLGAIDPCSVLRYDVLASLPMHWSSSLQVGPNKHSCDIHQAQPRQRVTLWFLAGFADGPPDKDQTIETIAARSTAIERIENGCMALTRHIPFTAGTGTGVEEALVVVEIAADQPDPCAIARSMAAVLWPKLPAA